MEVSLTKTKFINTSDIKPIQESVPTFLTLWVQYFSDHFAASRDFAPSGIKACSVDISSDSTGEELLSAWELCHSNGDGSVEKYHDDTIKRWKIIIEIKSLRQAEMRSPARPTLNRKGGLQVVRSSLQGFTITMTLYSSNLDCLRPKDAFSLENNLKKFFNDTSYQLIVQVITHCELPKFDHGGKSFREIYQINAKLKSGAFATVCKGRNRSTGEPCAIKCIPRNALKPWDEVDILSEVSIMSKLSHPNIVQLIDFFAQPDCYLIVMDFCEGGDLFDRIGRRVDSIKDGNGTGTVNKIGYSERDARDLCAVLLEVVRYCHEDMRVAHCDLKPRNLLLQDIGNDSSIKLADFGFATFVTSPKSITKRCGTPFFVAPEILKKKPYDESADMWSLGIIIYLLLGGTMPFVGRTQQELFHAIIEGKYSFPDEYWHNVSPAAKELVSNLLQVDPDLRWTARQALQCKWIQQLSAVELAKHDLRKSARELKLFNARLKFKAAIIGVAWVQGWQRRRLKKENENLLLPTAMQGADSITSV